MQQSSPGVQPLTELLRLFSSCSLYLQNLEKLVKPCTALPKTPPNVCREG